MDRCPFNPFNGSHGSSSRQNIDIPRIKAQLCTASDLMVARSRHARHWSAYKLSRDTRRHFSLRSNYRDIGNLSRCGTVRANEGTG